MLRELFRIPYLDTPIWGYGLMMVIGFLVLLQVAQGLARRKGINPEIFGNAAVVALIAGIIGARVCHVLENLDDYTLSNLSAWQNFGNMINIMNGGLTFYGGFLFAVPILVGYAIIKKVPLKVGLDIAAPCIMIGLAFGRVGCFLNGCCYGELCEAAWAVRFPYASNAYFEQYDDPKLRPLLQVPRELELRLPDGRTRLLASDEIRGNMDLERIAAQQRALPVQPTQLYSAFTAFLLAGLLLAYFTLPHAPGRAFALMLMLEGSTRFLLEMIRVEKAMLGPLSLSMVIGAGIMFGGVVLWMICGLGYQPLKMAKEPARSGRPCAE